MREAETGQAVPGQWFRVRARLSRRARILLAFASILLPLSLWSAVTYVPFIWHPDMLVSDPGDVDYFQPGMRVTKSMFRRLKLPMPKPTTPHRLSARRPIRFICPHRAMC